MRISSDKGILARQSESVIQGKTTTKSMFTMGPNQQRIDQNTTYQIGGGAALKVASGEVTMQG